MLGFNDDQATCRPVSAFPFASRATADACVVWPTLSTGAANVAETVATAGGPPVTVSVASPALASTVARIVTVPPATAVTRPVEETIATLWLSEVHETPRPVRVAPLASVATTVACVVCPAERLDDARDTVTAATGGPEPTDACASPKRLSALARMLAVPPATAVTTPEGDTVATAGLDEDQVIVRPV